MNMLRPISRKYDQAEHEYPKELDMLAAMIDGLAESGASEGAGAVGVRRDESEQDEGVRNGANLASVMSIAEMCWGDVGLLLSMPRQGLGNSAIASVAPVIGASKEEIASSISLTAVLGVIVVLSLPVFHTLLSYGDYQYGVLAGMSVYAVPQVVAAGYSVSKLAGDTATLVKLVRVLMIGPVVFAFSLMAARAGKAAVMLNANESPYAPFAGDALALNRYPDPQPAELLEQLANAYGVNAGQIFVGRGSDEAIEEGLYLTRFASRVHFLSPSDELIAPAELVEELKANPRVALYRDAKLKEISGNGKVDSATFALKGGEELTLPISGAFIYLQGGRPITDFLEGQLEISEKGCLMVDREYRTSIPGVYAVGDVLCEHIKQVVIAAGEGALAGMSAEKALRGRRQIVVDWAK